MYVQCGAPLLSGCPLLSMVPPECLIAIPYIGAKSWGASPGLSCSVGLALQRRRPRVQSVIVTLGSSRLASRWRRQRVTARHSPQLPLARGWLAAVGYRARTQSCAASRSARVCRERSAAGGFASVRFASRTLVKRPDPSAPVRSGDCVRGCRRCTRGSAAAMDAAMSIVWPAATWQVRVSSTRPRRSAVCACMHRPPWRRTRRT